MTSPGLAVRGTGLVASVGLSAPPACAAIRAKLTNPSETRFIDSGGDWIVAHRVPMEKPWTGSIRLVKMAARAIAECLTGIPREDWSAIPLLLCVAERERPGRAANLEANLLEGIQDELGVNFAHQSVIVPRGRVGVAIAFGQARTLVTDSRIPYVLIAASDSLLSWPTISHYERSGRLLTAENANGFMAGEGAGALLVGTPTGGAELVCVGLGFGVEAAHIDSEQPLRGDGLTQAIKAALADAGRDMSELDVRITDLSGEQYYFKEASLALSRILRKHKEEIPLWHPAECIGEQGATVGTAVVVLADAACRKAFIPGPLVLGHMANDAGQRAALLFEVRDSR